MNQRFIPITFKVSRRLVALPVCGALMFILSLCSTPLSAETAQQSGADSKDDNHREAEKVVSEIEMEIFLDGKWSKVERIEKPLLFYGDLTRNNDRGSVWGWGRKGRPVATMELFQDVNDHRKWVFAICNTSGKKLRATRAGVAWWRENNSVAELKDVPNAPAPSAEAPQRQRQLKLLAQKFTGYQFWDPNNSRYELRRLERPLHTYQNEADGILDGALFTLANGTNPEIMLFVEARSDPTDGRKTKWQFAVGRSAHAELHMDYEGKEVYSAPRGGPLSARDKPYWLDFITTASPRQQEKE